MVGGNYTAIRGNARHMVGQRSVVTDIERASAGSQCFLIDRQSQLSFSRAGRADNAQPEWFELDLSCPGGEA